MRQEKEPKTGNSPGNVLVYEYRKEDGLGVTKSIFEKNRHAYSQQYLKRVLYGNTLPYYSSQNQVLQPIPVDNEWLFELVFDYGEHATVQSLPQYAASQTWLARLDAFSSYRAGFEIRTYRLCHRVLMFHRFADLGPNPCLVKATLLDFDENPIATQLKRITHAGYLTENGATDISTFPPLSFRYTEQKIDPAIYSIQSEDLPNAPEGIDGNRYRWVDLEGEGLSGILSQTEGAWYYKRNLGDATFGPRESVRQRPSLAGAGVADYDGNGLNDYVLQNGLLNGYYEMDSLGEWQNFRAFSDIPNIDWNDPNLRSLDLDGDGIADLLLTENDCWAWYLSNAKDGFGPARRVAKALDEEQGPRIVFQEAFQTIFLSDLSGSGMTDICRIRNGEVCYWPNLGYGRFGAKVTMANAPHFDLPDAFDPSRIKQWTAWEKVELAIDAPYVSPVMHLGKLYVFWVGVVTMEKNTFEGGTSKFESYAHNISLSYSNLNETGKWLQPQKVKNFYAPLPGEGRGDSNESELGSFERSNTRFRVFPYQNTLKALKADYFRRSGTTILSHSLELSQNHALRNNDAFQASIPADKTLGIYANHEGDKFFLISLDEGEATSTAHVEAFFYAHLGGHSILLQNLSTQSFGIDLRLVFNKNGDFIFRNNTHQYLFRLTQPGEKTKGLSPQWDQVDYFNSERESILLTTTAVDEFTQDIAQKGLPGFLSLDTQEASELRDTLDFVNQSKFRLL